MAGYNPGLAPVELDEYEWWSDEQRARAWARYADRLAVKAIKYPASSSPAAATVAATCATAWATITIAGNTERPADG